MNSRQVILDTDILSLLMRKNPPVLSRAQTYLSEHRQFTISIITRYEILRGLKAKGAQRQAVRFEEFCSKSSVLSVTEDIVVKAADIYADLYKRGQLIGDADILIAATALVHYCGIATNNESHFRRIAGLEVTNWAQ